MKVLAIGDPHGNLEGISKMPLKEADIILLTGDIGSANLMRKMSFDNVERLAKGLPKIEYSPTQKKRAFMEAYNSSMKLIRHLARFAPVFTIFGNVESSNRDTKAESKKIGLKLPLLYDSLIRIPQVSVINGKGVDISGLKVGGIGYFEDSCWVREFKPSKYQKRLKKAVKDTHKASKILNKFEGLDILVAHQPPLGILDKVSFSGAPKSWLGKHAGSKALLDYIKRRQPRYVFCGHIHEAAGEARIGRTQVYNLGCCEYRLIDI